MTTYPLTFPAVGVVSSSFKLVRAVSSSFSPFTFNEQVYRHQGERWEGTVQFKPVARSNAALIQAFILELDGSYGTFLYGDPDCLALGKLGAGGGTPLVAGAGQTGTTLNIDGCTALVTNWLKKGDYFQLGSGSGSQLYCLIENASTNTGGATTLTFRPTLRSSPADNAAVTITSPKGVFRLTDSSHDWRSNHSSVYDIPLSFREAIIV